MTRHDDQHSPERMALANHAVRQQQQITKSPWVPSDAGSLDQLTLGLDEIHLLIFTENLNQNSKFSSVHGSDKENTNECEWWTMIRIEP